MRHVVLGATRLRLSRWAERPAPRTPSGDSTAVAFFLGVFSVRPLAFFPPFGWLARLAVWPSVLCVLMPVWLFGVAPLLPCRVGSAVGSLVWLGWSGSAVAMVFFLYSQTSINIASSSIIVAFLQIFSYLCTIIKRL